MNHTADDSDRLLTARVADAIAAAQDYSTRYIGFLDEHGASVVLSAARGYPYVRMFGGYGDAQRVFAAVYPEYCEPDDGDYPIAAVTVLSRRSAQLCHRDYLGSLMSLGITRESVGDILCEDGRAVVFLTAGVSDYVLGQLDKVGGEGVKVSRGFTPPLPQTGSFEEVRLTVSSARLDCIVGALCGKSRTASAELIESGAVSVNSVQCCSVSRKIQQNDKVAVRGNGKYRIDDLSNITRKGRTVLLASKYI